MKLFDLAESQTSKQAAKVFESYFGDSINVDVISQQQARLMLNKVYTLVSEHRATPAFHHSEKDPVYLKLMMMERVLRARVKETSTIAVGQAAGAPQLTANSSLPNPTVQNGDMLKQQQNQQNTANAQQQAAADDQASAMQSQQSQLTAKQMTQQMTQQQMTQQQALLAAALAKNKNNQPLTVREQKIIAKTALFTESKILRRQLYNILRESEIQQAQVMVAARALVDEIQKILEDVSSMQFKELPPLVDEMKNQIGLDKARQFNQDATAALGGLVNYIQDIKMKMEQALAIVVGQGTPDMMDQEMGDDFSGDEEDDLGMNDEIDTSGLGIDDEPEDEPELPNTNGAGLGRAKR
jgi:hypothetical protein